MRPPPRPSTRPAPRQQIQTTAGRGGRGPMFLQAEKSTPGQRAEAADALRAEENRKAQLRTDSLKNLKGKFGRTLSNLGFQDTNRTQESQDALDALAFQQQLNASLQERLTGLMDMVESQSECIRGLEAAATVANARIQELEAQIREGGGRVRERVRSGGLVRIGEGAVSADGRHNIGARSGGGSLGDAGGRGSESSPHRRRRSGGERRRRASSSASSVASSSAASSSSAQTV